MRNDNENKNANIDQAAEIWVRILLSQVKAKKFRSTNNHLNNNKENHE
jgi:hypothetical protein